MGLGHTDWPALVQNQLRTLLPRSGIRLQGALLLKAVQVAAWLTICTLP